MSLANKNNKKFTYTDYATWLDDERWELIDAVACNMIWQQLQGIFRAYRGFELKIP